MKKNLTYILLLLLAAAFVNTAWAEEEFDDEDVVFDENGEALNADEEVRGGRAADFADDTDGEESGDAVADTPSEPAGEAELESLTTPQQEGEGALSETEAEKVAEKLFKCPTYSEYMSMIHSKGGSDRVIKTFTSSIKMQDQADVNSLFKYCRQLDVKRLAKGASTHSSRLTTAWKGTKLATAESSHFLAAFPAKCKGVKDGKPAECDTAEFYDIQGMLSAADTAFETAVEQLLIRGFICWSGKVRAKVFFVVDPKNWNILKSSGLRYSPVRTVYSESGYREFYVYLNPKNIYWNAEALSYAVAEEVLNEFMLSCNRKGRVNDFLRVGFAAYCSGLTSVVKEDGPVQVSRFQNKSVSYDDLVKAATGKLPFKSLPLEKSSLIQPKFLTDNGEPQGDEKLYYFMRQSAAIVEYLNARDALPLVYLFYKSYRSNRKFEEDYDNYFCSLHRDAFMGKKSELKSDKKDKDKDKDKKEKKDKDAEGEKEDETEDIGNNYKAFVNRVPSIVFYPLTTDSVIKDIQAEKASEKAKAEKAGKPGKPGKAEKEEKSKSEKKSKKDK